MTWRSSPDSQHYLEVAIEEIKVLVETGHGHGNLSDYLQAEKLLAHAGSSGLNKTLMDSLKRTKHLVPKGYSQCPGLDYTKMFTPTTKFATLHTILAIAAIEDIELESLDISSAFLNGDLDSKVYLQQPEGFHQGDSDCIWWLL